MRDGFGILGDFLHCFEERLVEHVAAFVDHCDQNAVGSAKLFLVVEKRFHVRIVQRDLFLEAGIDFELRCEIGHHRGDHREHDQHQNAIAEHEVLGSALESIRLFWIGRCGHGLASAQFG